MTRPLTVDDRIAIKELFARYAWALDTGDSDALADTFTPDGVIIEEVFEEPDVWEGRDGVRRLGERFRNVPDFPGRQHHVGHVLVEGDGERATARSFVFVSECQDEPPFRVRFCGHLEDELVRLDGRWLFAKRVIRSWTGPVLARFPGHGERVALRRPPQLVVKR